MRLKVKTKNMKKKRSENRKVALVQSTLYVRHCARCYTNIYHVVQKFEMGIISHVDRNIMYWEQCK